MGEELIPSHHINDPLAADIEVEKRFQLGSNTLVYRDGNKMRPRMLHTGWLQAIAWHPLFYWQGRFS